MKAFLERWLESKADEPSPIEEVQREAVTISFSREATTEGEVMPQSVRALDDEIAWRLEAFRQQIPQHGAIPFLVAREAVKPKADCCLSCGDPLNQSDAYRCAACSRAANLALEISVTLSKTGTESGGRVD